MPPGVTTLATVRTSAQQRADMVNSTFISTAEWNGYINASYFELYDLLVQKYGDNYYVQTPYSFTTDGTNNLFALPSDFYKLLGVDLQVSGIPNGWISVHPFQFADRNQYAIPNFQAWLGVTNLQYRLSGSNIHLIPLPAAGQTLRLWYVPRLASLVNDSDAVDGVSGWEEYIVVDAAVKALQKEESDVSVLMAQKSALIQRIESAAANRDAGTPATVADVQSHGYGWPGTGGYWGGV